MNQNIEFLNYIHQNAEMGLTTINQLIKIAEDEKFLKHLKIQLEEYRNIDNKAIEMLHKENNEEKDINKLAKISAYMNIAMKTMMDKTPSRISEIMMQGSVMGIIDILKNLKRYPEANDKIKTLAKKLLATEESNIEHLKEFIG